MTKIVIIHGTKGSPEGNWFPWLAAELRRRNQEVLVPRMPTPEGQNLENWLKTFESEVGALDKSSILIGHSVGAVFVLRVLEHFGSPIHAAFLVAGFTGPLGIPEYDALNATFVAAPFDWQRIRANSREFVCLSGDNDPYVPLAQGQEIASNLKVELQVVTEGGHLNAEFGFVTFPGLLEEILGLQ